MAFCKSNYDTQSEKVSVYQFPKNQCAQQNWLRALPNSIEITPHIGVCRKHWPEDAEFFKCFRYHRPKDPPSIFPHCENRLSLQTRTLKCRDVEKRGICAEKRNAIPDEKEMFDQMDLLPIWSEFVSMIRESDIVKTMASALLLSQVTFSSI